MDQSFASSYNRKLLVSVFNAQEAREAVLGGGRIIDSEDPKSALGNISPRNIMDISDAVLDFHRDLNLQLSTNIGEDQLLFRRSQTGQAIEKSRYEIAGKAAQAAIGVSVSMGTRVHPVNIVKAGVDGMPADKIGEVLSEVVATLKRTEALSHTQVMSVLFAQDLELWAERKRNETVRRTLVESHEFNPAAPDEPGAFDISPYAAGTFRGPGGKPLFSDVSQVSLEALIRHGILPSDVKTPHIRLNELFPHATFFPDIAKDATRTNRAVIKAMVDVTADSGANAIMIDTSILTKVMNVCLVDSRSEGMVDINSLVVKNDMVQQGILSLEDLRFFVEYCHYRGVSANVAGSIDSYQAQQLWVLLPELDQASTRGASSGVDRDPSLEGQAGVDSRRHRVIKRSLVRGLAPPEHGGVLNLPEKIKKVEGAKERVKELVKLLRDRRKALGLPELQAFWVDPFGRPTVFK